MAKCGRAHASQVRLALERISKRERIKLQLAKTHAQLAEVMPPPALAACLRLRLQMPRAGCQPRRDTCFMMHCMTLSLR